MCGGPASKKSFCSTSARTVVKIRKQKEGQHVVHSTGRGEEKQKKKGRTSPRLYIVPYLHSNVSFLYHAYWTLLERLSTERKSTLEWLRCASVDDCVLYWMCRPHFFLWGAVSAKSVFRSVDFAEKKRSWGLKSSLESWHVTRVSRFFPPHTWCTPHRL